MDQPTTTAKVIKRLRPNVLPEFELRVGDLSVLYNVENDEVILLIVGRKVGNTLVVESTSQAYRGPIEVRLRNSYLRNDLLLSTTFWPWPHFIFGLSWLDRRADRGRMATWKFEV